MTSALSQILSLRKILEEIRDQNLQAVVAFIDFLKAFGVTQLKKLLQIHKGYRVTDIVVIVIKMQYEICPFVCSHNNAEFFEILAGILQVNTLALFLFIVALHYPMRIAARTPEDTGFLIQPRQIRSHSSRKIDN